MKKLEIGNERVNKKLGSDWITMDIKKGVAVDVVHDLKKLPLPFESSSMEIIYMSHVLEHVPWFMVERIINDLYRILSKNGIIEIWVPDLEKLVNAYIDNSLIKKDGWYKYNPDKDPTIWFNGRIFTYGPGEENFHRAVFDFRYLKKILLKTGFFDIKRLSNPRGYDHGWINLGIGAIK